MAKLKWKCNLCGDVITSDSAMSHQMDFCKCGESGVDLEEYYMRGFGDYTVILPEEQCGVCLQLTTDYHKDNDGIICSECWKEISGLDEIDNVFDKDLGI